MAHTVQELYPFLRIELPGILEPALQAGVYEAVDEFLRESDVWRYTIPTLLDWETTQTFPDILEAVEIPANSRVVRIDIVKYASDGINLKTVPFSTRQQLDGEFPNWEVRTGNSPARWTYDGPGTPRLVPIATANVLGSIQVRVILSADRETFVLPSYLVHEYGDAIKWGALARLMKIPGKDWTNEGGAAVYASLFEKAKKKAKSRSEAEYGQPSGRYMSYGGI